MQKAKMLAILLTIFSVDHSFPWSENGLKYCPLVGLFHDFDISKLTHF